MSIYVDTSAWIALHEPKDHNHKTAVARLKQLVQDHEVLVTGWNTVVELADGLARHYSQKEASEEVERLLSSPRVRVAPSEPHIKAAREMFRKNFSWGIDLSDCLSFVLMRTQGIERVFTYDADFQKAGFHIEG